MEEETHTYHCNVCGKEMDWDDFHWLNAGFGTCDHCYDIIPEEMREKISDEGYGTLLSDTCEYLSSIHAKY